LISYHSIGKPFEAQNKPQMSSQEEKADSITERKPAKMVDISRQNGTKQQTPSPSRSHRPP